MEQLRDSRLMFEKKLPAFGYILLLIINLSVISVITWSIFAHKNYMIICQGTVTNVESNYVMSAYSGVIDKSYMYEGKVVSESDELFTVKSTDYNLQEEQLVQNKKAYEEKNYKVRASCKIYKRGY